MNDHVQLHDGSAVEWSDNEANRDIFSILGDGAISTRIPLPTTIFDLKSCFHKLAIDPTEQWKHIFHIRGDSGRMRAACSWRVQMGRGAAPHSEQRLSIPVVKLLTNTAIAEGWVIEQTRNKDKYGESVEVVCG